MRSFSETVGSPPGSNAAGSIRPRGISTVGLESPSVGDAVTVAVDVGVRVVDDGAPDWSPFSSGAGAVVRGERDCAGSLEQPTSGSGASDPTVRRSSRREGDDKERTRWPESIFLLLYFDFISGHLLNIL